MTKLEWPDDKRINNIGRNGGTGEHYNMKHTATRKSPKSCLRCSALITTDEGAWKFKNGWVCFDCVAKEREGKAKNKGDMLMDKIYRWLAK